MPAWFKPGANLVYKWSEPNSTKICLNPKLTESNIIEIRRIETATYSNKAYFPGEHFLYC